MKAFENELLQIIPCVVNIPQEKRGLWELCWQDVWRPESFEEWKTTMDSTIEENTQQTLFVSFSEDAQRELTETYEFPMLQLPDVPPLSLVNKNLQDHFHQYGVEGIGILQQSHIPEEIESRIASSMPDIVVFLIFDGLSFYDTIEWQFSDAWNIRHQPCLVDGLSTTSFGMQRLIGSPCLAHRLFRLGYKDRLGFSYWEREQNPLTNTLFDEFPPSQFHKVTTFEEVLERISQASFEKRTFMQIIRNGLDQACHYHREKTDTQHLIHQLRQSVEHLLEVLRFFEKRVRIFIAADHGILWFNDQAAISVPIDDSKPRYITGIQDNIPNAFVLKEHGTAYTVLTGDTSLTRKRKVTEWGFHGGISAQESLIPFFDINNLL